ncbi:hypothetical protein L226DRAFT_570267 [Lentinus tigrinus ALCF2SS1-7]|uniref:uncharacterized protein n=1 Tax=Lentinus tigrinus ALCF2SS1-7 TaxID=1328758 RepID=UPI001165DE67|nr:hypothetical protein L226DRAFT_570267 [Lentinus tigrinus ALCF2SS1-7]
MQYKIELAAVGMEDGPYSALNVSQRLAMLKERHDAWNTLSWRSHEDIPAPKNCPFFQEFHGGVFARQENDRTLYFSQLPSHIRGIGKAEWTVDIGVRFDVFGTDPAQDLLVIVQDVEEEDYVVLRTSEVLDYWNACWIKTSGDHLAVLWSSRDNDDEEFVAQLVVWNWKTGITILHVMGDNINSFVFLTPSYILLLANHHSIHIDSIAFTPCLIVLDLQQTPRPSEPIFLTELGYLCAFSYPVLDVESTIPSMTLRADLGPGCTHSPSVAVPFSVSRNDRLLVVTLEVLHRRPDMTTLLSFIPSSTLLSLIETLPPSGRRGHSFAWQEWGPAGSRFHSASSRFSTDGSCYDYVNGAAFAQHFQIPSYHSRLIIELYDFNQLACRRMHSSVGKRAGAETDRSMVVTEPTVLVGPGRHIFEQEVTTSCPYIRRQVVLFDQKNDFIALLLGEDSLILVSNKEISKPFYRVLTF